MFSEHVAFDVYIKTNHTAPALCEPIGWLTIGYQFGLKVGRWKVERKTPTRDGTGGVFQQDSKVQRSRFFLEHLSQTICQWGQVALNRAPDNLKTDTEILMRNNVAHSAHLQPG